MTEKIIPDGYKLVAVKGLDELVYWLERCKDKGHLENCADLIEPFEAFEYRNVSEEAVIAAHEAKAAPAQEVGGSVQLRGLDDSSAMLRVRTILESRACYLAGSTIAEIVDAAKPDAPAVPDVMSILRAIHRRPSDAGIWLDDITRILRDAPAPAVPQGEPVDFDSIIADIEAIDCVYRGDPSYDYDPRDIREQAANVVRHHATHYVTPAAPSQPAVPSVLKRGYGRLIQAAADLALQQFMPSDIVDDYPSKTISAAKVAKMMTQPRDRLRLLSIEVSEGAKQMLAATHAAPSQEHAVNLSCRSTQARLAAQWGYVPAPSQEPAVPQGWKLVPIEPTPEMGRAYLEAAKIHAAEGAEDKMRFSPGGYAAMLSAAPSQPVTLTDEEIKRNWSGGACPPWGIKFARAIIAALREKEQTK